MASKTVKITRLICDVDGRVSPLAGRTVPPSWFSDKQNGRTVHYCGIACRSLARGAAMMGLAIVQSKLVALRAPKESSKADVVDAEVVEVAPRALPAAIPVSGSLAVVLGVPAAQTATTAKRTRSRRRSKTAAK